MFSLSARCRWLAAAAGVAVATALALPAAALGQAVTVTLNPASVQPGGTSTVTAGMPVSNAGTVSQEIVQTIDPTKAVLTGLSDISKPVGWGLSFFDGSAWSNTTPANVASWAQVTKVKTSGTINSQGSESGYQIAVGTANGAVVNLTPPTIPASGGGDGFMAFFDAGRTRVFNVYHHKTGGDQLDCHVLATGSTCAGFPFAVGIQRTGYFSSGRVVGTRIWIPAYKRGATTADDSVGFYCVDISAVLASGGSPALCSTSYVPLAVGANVNVRAGGVRASDEGETEFQSIDGLPLAGSGSEGRLWGLVVGTGKVVCLDTATAAACSGMPANGWSTAVKGWRIDGNTTGGDKTSLVVSSGRVYVLGSNSVDNVTRGSLTIACVLTSNPTTECPGFTGGKDLGAAPTGNRIGRLVELPAADGSPAGVCILGDTRSVPFFDSQQSRSASSTTAVPCWDATGAAFSGPASLSTMVTSSFVYSYTKYQHPMRAGSRIYWGNGVLTLATVIQPTTVFCWDAAKNSGAGGPCANLPDTGYSVDNYTITPDPAIPDCIWITRHNQPNLLTYNMVSNVSGCSSIAPTRASFPGTTLVPRMACSTSPGAVRAWRTFTLTSPPPGANFSVVLTVKDSSGMPIPGWINIPVTAGTAVDLSSLSPAATGVSPTFDVDFTITSGSISAATAEVKAVGDAPELCLTVQANLTCSAVAAPGPIPAPANSSSMALLAEGSATDSQNQTSIFAPASGTLSIAAPTVAQCSGTLGGQAVDTSPTPRPAAGVTVALLDSSGHPVVYPAGDLQAGQPVTTTTDASGNYAFPGLAPASYKVRFVDAAAATVVSSTVASGGSGTATASSGAVESNASAVTVGGTSTVNAIYTLAPVAPSRTATTAMNTAVVLDPFAVAGSSSAATPSTGSSFAAANKAATRLCDSTTTPAQNGTTVPCTLTSRVVSGQGTWSVNTDSASADAGKITFTPNTGYTGAADAITYGVTDAANQKAAGTLTATVVGAPSATSDTSTGDWDTNQTISVLTNDSAASGASLGASTVKLCPNPQPSTPYTASNCNLSTLTISNEGTYTANADGTVTFDPLPAFSGQVPTPVRYVVQDTASQVASALITPTVNPPAAPVATSETNAVIPGGTATFSNLITGAGALATGSGLQTGNTYGPCLVDPSDSVCKATFAIAGEGTWTVNRSTGVATFVASGSATAGTKTPVTYRVTDAVGQTATSTLTPTIPAPPAATNDTSTGAWDTNQIISVLTNDSAASGASLVASTVKLCPNPQPSTPYTASNCNLSTLTISNEGTYTANADGTVTFDPLPAFSGQVPTPVRYVVQDNATQVASALITPTVTPPALPVATPETKAVIPGGTATFTNLIVGGSARATGTGLQTGNTSGPCLVDPSDSVCKATFSIAGEGTWAVNRTTGVATFVALSNATPGTKTPVTYRVTDAVGQTATSTLTPTIPPPPAANPDTSVGAVDTNQTTRALANDTAASGISLAPSTVRICTTATATGSCTGTALTILGEGTYTANADGTVTFDPLPTFTGTATPIKYVVEDTVGQKASSTITPQVVAIPAPAASPDTTTGLPGATQTVSPVLNDTPGAVAHPLDPSTVRLCSPSETAPACTQASLTTADGVFTVNPLTGAISFQPVSGFLGTAAPVTYAVSDTAFQRTSTTYTPSVVGVGPPQVAPSTVAVAYGAPGNMTPQVTLGSAPLDPAKSCLAAPGATCTPGETSLTRPEGTYVLDPSTGVVTFTPQQGYSGTPSDPPLFCATDTAGQSACATLTPTVAPQPADATTQGDPGRPLPGAPSPAALPDVESTMAGQAVTLRALTNDSPSSGAMLNPASVQLRDPRTGRYQSVVTVPGQGTFRVNRDGSITFTPQAGFVGTTPAITYRVSDSLGKTTTSTITVIVRDTPPPWADPQFDQAMRGQTVIFDPIGQANPGSAPLVPGSVRIKDPATGKWTTRVVVPGEGTWRVDTTTGKVRFTPLPSFTGSATPLAYRVADRRGQRVSSTLNPVIRSKGPALEITTRATRTVLRPGQRSLITLRIANQGLATTTSTITRAPIPKGFAVINPMGGTVRGGWIRFATGNLKSGGSTTRRFVLVATAAGTGRGDQQLTGWATSTNTRSVNDPTALRVIGAVTGKPAVTG